jgi:hypothetical protein
MRWEERLFALFDDLEGQAAALWEGEREAELADRARAEYRHVTLASRLVASVGDPVGITVRGVGRLEGELQRVGEEWCLVRAPRQDWVVRIPAIAVVDRASPRSVPEVAWSPVQRLGLGSALRRLAESGDRCVVHLLDGSRYDGPLGRAGADFVEVATAAGRTVLVAHAALAAVQSRDDAVG